MEGAAILGIAIDAVPLHIIELINAYVATPPRDESQKVDNWTDRAVPLGALWGQQMVRAFDWEWAEVVHHDHNDVHLAGVFNRERSLAVYPLHYVFGCLKNEVYPTILLAFNMLTAGKIPELEAGGYVNLMDGVQHVVPPR